MAKVRTFGDGLTVINEEKMGGFKPPWVKGKAITS